MFTAGHLFDLLVTGWLATLPLTIGSILTLTILMDRLRRFRGLEAASRTLASGAIEALSAGRIERARNLCEHSELPVASMLREAMRWRDIALEDYERILATRRAELVAEMRRGLWVVGTVGSLAPFVGLFGTVVGIIRAFADMAKGGGGGFAVVAASLSEALVATAAGLAVAIVALAVFNYLNTRVGALAALYARAAERLVQAILFLESGANAVESGANAVESGAKAVASEADVGATATGSAGEVGG